MSRKFILSFFLSLLSASAANANNELVRQNMPVSIIDTAHASIIDNKGKIIGKAILKQGSEGVLLRIKISDLPPGFHGMHFHEVGDCSDHSHFDKAKGHIITHEKLHGFFNEEGPHEADLPNLIIQDDGATHVEIYTNMISLVGVGWKPELLDNDGSSIIIHENQDDHVTQPTGNSGGRIACGVIQAGVPAS